MLVDKSIRSRKSQQRFLPALVSAPVVHHILSLSARTPRGNNAQPRRVYAVADAAGQRLCEAILDAQLCEIGVAVCELPERIEQIGLMPHDPTGKIRKAQLRRRVPPAAA